MKRHHADCDIYGVPTECICPKCRCKHTRKLNWTGRGKPWKFCPICMVTVEKHESTAPARFNAFAAIHGATMKAVGR